VFGYDPEKIDPVVEDLGCAPQKFTSGKENVQCRSASAFEEFTRTIDKANEVK